MKAKEREERLASSEGDAALGEVIRRGRGIWAMIQKGAGLTSCAEGVSSGKFYSGTSRKSIRCPDVKGRTRRTPHAGNELGETADKAGHTNDGVRDGNTTSLDVNQGENKSGAREGEKTAEGW